MNIRNRLYLFLLLFSVIIFQPVAQAATADYDIVHYDVKCEVHPKEKTFHSLTRIKIKNGDEPLSRLSLFVSDYKIQHVRKDGKELHFVVNARWMGIRFKEPVLPSQEIEIEVESSADKNSEIYLKENEFLIDSAPSKFSFLSFTSGQEKDLFTFHLDVTIPDQFTVVSMGQLTSVKTKQGFKTFTWESLVPYDKFFFIGNSKYRIKDISSNKIKMSAYLLSSANSDGISTINKSYFKTGRGCLQITLRNPSAHKFKGLCL